VLGVTLLVKTLDKARQALYGKENYKDMYYQTLYKDTLTLVQSQMLAAQTNCQKKLRL